VDAAGRYLPFEGSGAISEWQLELPVTVAQFDPDTIADVVLHLRYTAREGGKPLRDAAVANLTNAIKAATTAGSVRLLSVRHDFATQWAKFTSIDLGNGEVAPLTLTLREEHYPYWSRVLTENGQSTIAITREVMIAQPADHPIEIYDNPERSEHRTNSPTSTPSVAGTALSLSHRRHSAHSPATSARTACETSGWH
jgi:Tc toxin complex TcA C-terminal TcB-binding domain